MALTEQEQKLQEENQSLRGTITELLQERINDKINAALIEEGAGDSVDLLAPHVEKQVRIIQDDNASTLEATFEVFNLETGNGRINSKGENLTILELVQEMKKSATFAACFCVDNSNPNVHRPKTIHAADKAAMRTAKLEDIQAGKIIVDMIPKKVKINKDALPASDLIKDSGGFTVAGVSAKTIADIATGKTQVDRTK